MVQVKIPHMVVKIIITINLNTTSLHHTRYCITFYRNYTIINHMIMPVNMIMDITIMDQGNLLVTRIIMIMDQGNLSLKAIITIIILIINSFTTLNTFTIITTITTITIMIIMITIMIMDQESPLPTKIIMIMGQGNLLHKAITIITLIIKSFIILNTFTIITTITTINTMIMDQGNPLPTKIIMIMDQGNPLLTKIIMIMDQGSHLPKVTTIITFTI